jgi:transposase
LNRPCLPSTNRTPASLALAATTPVTSTAAAPTVPRRVCGCGCLTRPRHYKSSDLTDAQWAIIAPLLPPPPDHGRPEKHHRRAIIDAILYWVDQGIKWRGLPADYPPWRTVYGFLERWAAAGDTHGLVDDLRAAVRVNEGRDPFPTAGIIDAQSVHASAEGVVPAATSGFDAHKKVNGRKRHLIVDTLGLHVHVVITPADVADRDAARQVLSYAAHLGIRHVWADNGYNQRTLITWAKTTLGLTLEIVKRPSPAQKGFQLLHHRWVVERSNAWTSRRRRCARDYERTPQHHQTAVHWAAILHMTRRLTRKKHAPLPQPNPAI